MLLLFSNILRNATVNRKNVFFWKTFFKEHKKKKFTIIHNP